MIYDIQKPSLWKRISAWLFDVIMLLIFIAGFATIISAVIGFDATVEKSDALKEKYYKDYGIVEIETQEEWDKLSTEVQQKYIDAEEAFQNDKEANRLFLLMLSSILTITGLGIFFAMLVWEFILPLFLKNGQTLGKKIFGIAVIRTNGVKITPVQLFIRTVLGKYTFEVMVPVFAAILFYFTNFKLFAAIIVLIVLAVEIIGLLSTRRTRSTLHDLISDTVAVDLESQLIFSSEEELMKYKEEQHAKMANRSPY